MRVAVPVGIPVAWVLAKNILAILITHTDAVVQLYRTGLYPDRHHAGNYGICSIKSHQSKSSKIVSL